MIWRYDAIRQDAREAPCKRRQRRLPNSEYRTPKARHDSWWAIARNTRGNTITSPTPQAAWVAIAGRLEGIERTATIYAGFLGNSSSKAMPGADELIFTSCLSTWDAIKAFRETFDKLLPENVDRAIQQFGVQNEVDFTATRDGADFIAKRVFVMKLMILAGEITHGMYDHSEQIRSTAELAFRHLQQLIVVDKDVRRKWQDALAAGCETACEKLGGVHLLWHGIQAFKVHGDGGRTDLVFAEPIGVADTAGIQGLVLTEWKKGAAGNATARYASAKRQAYLYSAGVLGGVELRRYRFLVLVSEKAVRPPSDVVDGAVTYRHINIAVDPDKPSKAAAASKT